MKKYNIVIPSILIALLYLNTITAQNPVLLEKVPKAALDEYYTKIQKEFHKSDCYSKDQNYRMISLWQVSINGKVKKSDFEDTTFLQKINANQYYHKKKEIFKPVMTVFFDQDKARIASYSHNLMCYDSKEFLFNENEIIEYLWDKKNVYIFNISLSYFSTHFLVTESKEVFVIYSEGGKYQIYTIKEFVDNHWDELSHRWKFYGMVEKD